MNIATVANLKERVASACADFSGNDSLCAYQGDGDRQDEASDDPRFQCTDSLTDRWIEIISR